MTKNKIQRLLAILCAAAAAFCMVLGFINMPKQNGTAGQEILRTMRIQTLLNATGDSVVESYVAIAKQEAQAAAKASGGGMAAIREAVEKAETETREKYENGAQNDLSGIDTTGLLTAVDVYTEAVKAYAEAQAQARAAYEEAHYAEAEAALEKKHEEMLAAGEEIPEDEEVVVDMSGFEATPEMIEKQEEAKAMYANVGAELKKIYPVLTDEALETLEETVEGILYQSGDSFSSQYDRYVKQSNIKETNAGRLIRHGDDLVYLGFALLVLTVLLLFNSWLIDKLGIPRVIIGVFFILLCFMTLWYDLSLSTLLSNTIVRMGMNAIMVLAMVPGIQCGISLNLGLPFKSLKLRWPLGTGLRNTIGLDGTNFRHILNDFLAFQIGDFTIPTGLLLFMLFSCFVVWVFSRSRTGQAMQAVGNNPRFAESVGINVDKMRIIGTVFSTVLGAVGILVYSQSYGFMQLYTAPRQMGFIAASAILIGGASTSRCKISHVLIGTFLFQGVLTLGMPVANVLVPGSTISETLRILISNGIILYALTKSGGESRA